MPWDNVPQDKWDEMERCVNDVMAQGHDKAGATAICYSSIVKGKGFLDTLKSFFGYTDKATAEDNNLPDSAFLYVEPGGDKDESGKTVPRNLRHLPYRTAGGAIDLPRLRNALSRLGQPDTGTTGGDKWLTASLRDELRAKAQKILADETNKEIAHYKSIVDAPNLRTEDMQNCENCKYFQMVAGTESQPVTVGQSWKGICTQYEFETDGEWVCDSWEAMPRESFTVTKQADGRYRWLIVSSSSFRDRDGEIVSQKALEDDTERMNATGEYGTLDWWHTPVVLGACDFSAMHGMLSVESGTFDDASIGEKLAEHADELAASRSFLHPLTEPDASGTYNRIQTFARALLPRGRESNPLTQVNVSKEKEMLQDKIEKLKALLGGDKAAEEKVDALLASAEGAEKAALDAGVAHKEEAAKPAPEAKPEPKPEDKPTDDKPAWFLADMKPEEFGALIGKAMHDALEPVLAEVKALKEAQALATKEAVAESGKVITAEVAQVAKQAQDVAARVAMLEGLTPRGYRASQDPKTAAPPEVVKEKMPQEEPYLAQFARTMVLGQADAPKP